MRESTLEAQIVHYAKSKGCLAYKFSSPSQRGVPDRMIIGPTGKILFLEIKAPGRKPTQLQRYELAELRTHGMPATWVDRFDDAKILIRDTCLPTQDSPATLKGFFAAAAMSH